MVDVRALSRLQQFSWLFVLWFAVAGLGLIGGFMQFWKLQNQPIPVPREEPVLPQRVFSISPETIPSHTARSLWIFDRKSRSLLYEENAQTATSVASLAKLMTALVAYESYDVEAKLPVGSASAVLGNRAKFFPRDTFLVSDLLRAMLIFSANDAAQSLAQAHPQGDKGFVAAMNAKAADLKLRNSSFANSYGIDDPLQYSSAEDIGRIADTVLEIPLLADIVSQTTATLREQNTGRLDTVYTTNALLYKHPKYRGMKTGTTALAGESLVVRVVDDNLASVSATLKTATASGLLDRPESLDLILVILGSEDRFADAQKLTTWIESTVRNSSFSQP